MCELFKNVENSIEYKKGDIVMPRFNGKNYSFIMNNDEFYVVVSNYAWFFQDISGNNTKYIHRQVHQKDFDYMDVFMFGGWKVRAKSISTGKYKFFKQEELENIEGSYLDSIPGRVREIKMMCLI